IAWPNDYHHYPSPVLCLASRCDHRGRPRQGRTNRSARHSVTQLLALQATLGAAGEVSMSANSLTPGISISANSLTPVSPAPVAVLRPSIDYDFQTTLADASKQRFVLWLMIALVAAATAWLAVARVDIIINADGQLATSESEIVIQPLETSIVRSVMVRVGQRVAKGEVLATLDP